jgi:hypothetical protein
VADVVDKDLGWAALQVRLAEVNGMNVRAGILSGVPKYPKVKGKVQVAKVAGVHGVHRILAKTWAQNKVFFNTLIDKAIDRIYKGVDPEVALLDVATEIRDAFRFEVEFRRIVDTGRLVEAIRGTVFDGASVVAGDDPKRPRFTDKGPFR